MEEGPGALVVSLDFELYWGVRDITSLARFKPRVSQLREAVPCLLSMFRARGIHATWATVGFLFFDTRERLEAGLPRLLPRYADAGLDPYPELAAVGPDEERDPAHYALSLVRAIAAAPHQEVGTHTFSHYYCLEDGQTAEAFRADLEAAVAAARAIGISLRSLVFPRNQVHPEYLEICAELGIRAYRGTSAHWLYRPRPFGRESQFRRALRLADAYINLSGHHGYGWPQPPHRVPLDIPASRLLRTWMKPLDALEPLRLARFRADLSAAAARGDIYHLWLHPEEFGSALDRNRAFFERVLDHYALLRERHGMESLSMGEVAARFEVERGETAAQPAAGVSI